MSRARSVVERVEEFAATKSAVSANLRYNEMKELLNLFGSSIKYCDAFYIVNTAFHFGYMKGFKAKKGDKS